MFGAVIGALVLAGIAFGIRAIYLKVRKKEGSKTTRWIIWAVVGTLFVLSLIGSLTNSYNEANGTGQDVSESVVEVDVPQTAVDTLDREPTPAAEIPRPTNMGGDVEIDADTQDVIDVAAAELAWDQTSMSDRVNICFMWGYDKKLAKDTLKAQGHTKGALQAMYDVFDRECGAY